MNELTNALPFSEDEIDKDNYTASLLGLCAIHHLIDEPNLIAIRNGLDSAFVETAEQFTKRESSTMPKKQAEQLYSSILYQVDVALLLLKSPQKAIELFNSLEISDIIKRGKSLILRLHEENKLIFKKAYQNRLNLPVYAYRYVMEKSFSEYSAEYSARFNARECSANIDYPLLGQPAYGLKSQGVMYIHEYYSGILCENEFCKRLDEGKIRDLLVRFGKQYRVDYRDMFFNITEVVLNNMLANALVNKPFGELALSSEDVGKLEQMFCDFDEQYLLACMLQAFSEQIDWIGNPASYFYLKRYIPKFSKELYARIQGKNSINYLVVSD